MSGTWFEDASLAASPFAAEGESPFATEAEAPAGAWMPAGTGLPAAWPEYEHEADDGLAESPFAAEDPASTRAPETEDEEAGLDEAELEADYATGEDIERSWTGEAELGQAQTSLEGQLEDPGFETSSPPVNLEGLLSAVARGAAGIPGSAGWFVVVVGGTPPATAFVSRHIAAGTRNQSALTDAVFYAMHPELGHRKLDPGNGRDQDLIRQWHALRNEIVIPALRRADLTAPPIAPATPPYVYAENFLADKRAALARFPTTDDAELLVEGEDDYAILGNRYTPQEKKHASTHPSGLILTGDVPGRLERRLIARAPWPLSVSRKCAEFGSGRLGEFVTDYNDFVHYYGEVLAAIGRLQDLLSAGAPEMPNLMTSRQKYALRPTTDKTEDEDKKDRYRKWRAEQAQYANVKGGEFKGLVYDVAATARELEKQRHEFWWAGGGLRRAIAEARRLGKNKPTYDALDLSLSDALDLTEALVKADPRALRDLAAKTIDIVVDARQKRKEYDRKMKEFAARVREATSEVKDRYGKLRQVENSYWEALFRHRQSVVDRDRALYEARGAAAHFGQRLALGVERRSVLAEIRMPILVADAWHALAVIGPPARDKLVDALKGRAVVEEASKLDLSWRPLSMGGSPANPIAEITQIRDAWKQAKSHSSILSADDVEEWKAVNKLWDEVFTKFYV